MKNTREIESDVRIYCRHYTDTFQFAKDSVMISEDGNEYIDFFSIAGSMNYGHNNEHIKEALIKYIQCDGIINELDIRTTAKKSFLEAFDQYILQARNLNYKIQFCGPSGTNAVEAALKLARKVTGRTGIFALMGSFHGMSSGSMAVTGDRRKHKYLGHYTNDVTFLPHPEIKPDFDTVDFMKFILENNYSGVDVPAAFIFETVQAEGGIYLMPADVLMGISEICKEYGIILICDDIQTGCGRTGTFFSFEKMGLVPDLVTMSKSISGIGNPMSILLIKPEYDQWVPGEHSGTFRGNQLAFVTATAAIDYWKTSEFEKKIQRKEKIISDFLHKEIMKIDSRLIIRGVGMIWGIDFVGIKKDNLPQYIRQACYQSGLIIECAGKEGTVLKIMPALTISDELLDKGLEILEKTIKKCVNSFVP